MSQVEIKLRLVNKLSQARTIVLEPWGGEYPWPAGVTLDVIAEGDSDYPLELELQGSDLTIYSFDSKGALLRIFQGGQELKSPPSR